MCGIFGFAGQSSRKTSALLQRLCIADEIRGKDSTGIVVQTQTECLIKKKALRGKEFVENGYTNFLFDSEYTLALGHNRLATTGPISDRCSHPFGVRIKSGWSFGIHNGVIRNKGAIAVIYGIPEPEVDSEVVFWAVAKMVNDGKELTEAIIEITKRIDPMADYAFAFLDTEKRDIYLWRSEGRPMVILDARKLGLGRWFASTTEVFSQAWQPLRETLGSIKKVTYREAKPHRLYRLKETSVLQVVKDISVGAKIPIVPESNWDRFSAREASGDHSQTDLFTR